MESSLSLPDGIYVSLLQKFDLQPLIELPLLPDSFTIPPLPYTAGILIGVIFVSTLIFLEKPELNEGVMVGFGTWMVVGATLRVINRTGQFPESIAYLTGTPAVYLTTFVAAGITWVVASRLGQETSTIVTLNGSIVSVMLIGAAIFFAARDESRTLLVKWPLIALILGTIFAGAAWFALGYLKPKIAVTAGGVGGMTILGHSLDGVSTAVGIDVFGAKELTPISRIVIDIGSQAPVIPEYLGSAWLFVVVKLVLASLIVWGLTDFINDRPVQGNILLGAVAAVGLGPGVHNILLFMVTGGA